MRRRLRTLVTALEHLREAVDPREPAAEPSTARPVAPPAFDDPDQLSVDELDELRRELADELERAPFTSGSRDR